MQEGLVVSGKTHTESPSGVKLDDHILASGENIWWKEIKKLREGEHSLLHPRPSDLCPTDCAARTN